MTDDEICFNFNLLNFVTGDDGGVEWGRVWGEDKKKGREEKSANSKEWVVHHSKVTKR
jgi:hypothetical protein